MQQIPNELLSLLSSRLKIGDMARPVVMVEVDRFVFIPGRTEELSFIINEIPNLSSLDVSWIYGEGISSVSYTSFLFPVQGYSLSNVTSDYGYREDPISGKQRFHRGIDIGCPLGTPILSPLDGKVVRINRNASLAEGLSINIQHAEGVVTKYFHLSEILVDVGTQVSRGQVIAKAGSTGSSTGSHLHFEVWVGGRNVDPTAYLTGERNIYNNSTNSGTGVVSEGFINGYKGEVLFREGFDSRNWYLNGRYTDIVGFTGISKIEKGWTLYDSGGKFVFTFPTDYSSSMPSFCIDLSKLNLSTPAVFDIGFSSNMLPNDGDFLILEIDGRIIRKFNDFKGLNILQEMKDIPIPKGSAKLCVKIIWGGISLVNNGVVSPKKLALDYMTLTKLEPLSPYNDKSISLLDPTSGGGEISDISLNSFVFNEKKEIVPLQVGQFTYMDTLVIPNIVNLTIDEQFEQESTTATITISNPNGYFSPDFNPFFFSDLPNTQSPWSQFINGFHVGVLSDNTPIRIFIGYGQNMVRVFTGLIDKVDIVGDSSELTITARDMYKKISEKVLTDDKAYPQSLGHPDRPMENAPWVKSAIIQDLIGHAGMYGWRVNENDLYYPDAIIEETYLIEINQRNGYYIRAVPDVEGAFELAEFNSTLTPWGWMNPFVEGDIQFPAYQSKVNEAIATIIKDTNYRSYCDRYGTYRLEKINLSKPIVSKFTEYENLITITKNIDMSRARNHLVVEDGNGVRDNFLDKELLLELKGELRTGYIIVPWAKTKEAKKEVAKRLFFDMKRLSRTLQVAIPGNPALDLLDRVLVLNKQTTTSDVYIIKGIKTSFSKNEGYIQVIDLMWSAEGAVV